MTDSSATYRHDITGLVGVFDRRLGDNDPHLIEVKPGAKPLAYTPIPHDAVDTLLASPVDADAPPVDADAPPVDADAPPVDADAPPVDVAADTPEATSGETSSSTKYNKRK